jgi:hypothetical protein
LETIQTNQLYSNTYKKKHIKTPNLNAKSVQAATLALQSVDHVHRSNGLALAVLCVRNGVANHLVQKVLNDNADFFVNQAGNALHSSSTGQTTNGWIRDTVDVSANNLK